MLPRLVLLTGTKGVGKDCYAQCAKELYPGQVRSIAIADWFKSLLSGVTGFDLQSFYDERKEMPYRKPLVLDGSLVHRIANGLRGSGWGYTIRSYLEGEIDRPERVLKTYAGQTFESNRKLMEFFGFEFFHKCFSDDLHCEITLGTVNRVLLEDPHCKTIIITDARTYLESKWFSDKWEGAAPVLRIKLELPDAEVATSGIEKAVADFPANWFHRVIINPKPDLLAFKDLVQEALK